MSRSPPSVSGTSGNRVPFQPGWCCGAAKRQGRQIGDAYAVLDLLWLLLTTVQAAVRPRQDLVLENLLLRHQLAVLTRPKRRRSRARVRTWDKLLWILARRFCAGWREHLSFVTPETVVRWHRQGWRVFWRWKSPSPGGRPHLDSEVRNLIAPMSRDNRLWGTERIRGELLNSASWSAIARFDAIAGEDQVAHRLRAGARSCATTLTISGPPIC